VGYWITTFGLIIFGFVAMFSIGRPFFLAGLALLILRPVRSRPAAFWPPLAAVIAWNVGYLAVAPWSCTATQTVGVGSGATGESFTLCSSLTGIVYSGPGVYNPPLEPANQAALLLASIAFVMVLASIVWVRRCRRSVRLSRRP
jgi:hypothetical protein